jgi:hypothetical protein
MGVKRGSLVCAAAGEQLFCIGGWDAADYLDVVCCLFGNPPLCHSFHACVGCARLLVSGVPRLEMLQCNDCVTKSREGTSCCPSAGFCSRTFHLLAPCKQWAGAQAHGGWRNIMWLQP